MGENYSPGVITWAWQPGRQHEDTVLLDPMQSHPGDAHTRCDIPAIETKRKEKRWVFFSGASASTGATSFPLRTAVFFTGALSRCPGAL